MDRQEKIDPANESEMPEKTGQGQSQKAGQGQGQSQKTGQGQGQGQSQKGSQPIQPNVPGQKGGDIRQTGQKTPGVALPGQTGQTGQQQPGRELKEGESQTEERERKAG